jgi:ABC-type bacteriocin/lantibiotic exporter with double-glycine peptidase domain
MVLNHHGIDVSLEETTSELYSPSLKGTLITDMRKFASLYFSSARIKKSTPCAVMEALSEGNPVILFVDLGSSLFSTPHYIVVVGYDIDSQELVYHNGYSKFLKAPFEVINEKWEKTGFLALFIDP